MVSNKMAKPAYPTIKVIWLQRVRRKGVYMAEITLEELNKLAKDPIETIGKSEKEYHDKVASVADLVTGNERIKLILLAGPSGSGKTTTANLIADAIRARGEEAMVVSLDDFYLDQGDERYPKLENGEPNYECPEALDLPYLEKTLEDITGDRAFTIPRYDFKTASRVDVRGYEPVGHGCVIIEGLHAMNPEISQKLDKSRILKLFVSVSTNVNEGGLRILSGRKARFIRRLVRDSIYRGASAEKTLSMWDEVLAAEDIYLYPYKEDADLAFNTFHAFELQVMKPFVKKAIPISLAAKSEYVAIVLSAIEKIDEIDHSLVPENSLIREFIPGGIYEALY